MHQENKNKTDKKIIKRLCMLVFGICCIWVSGFRSEAVTTFEVKGVCEESPKATIHIRVDAESNYSGFDIYRADDEGTYQFIDYVGIGLKKKQYDSSKDIYETDYITEKKKSVEYRTYTFTDPAELVLYQTYTYKVVGYQYVDDVKTELNYAVVEVRILPQGPEINYGKRTGKLGATIKWTTVPEADGYVIYCAENYDEESNYLYLDYYDMDNYQMLETIENAYVTSTSYDNLRNGVTYVYRVSAYKNVNGQRVESIMSDIKSVTMDYYSYAGESYDKKVKRAFGSAKKKAKNFKTSAKASKQMKTIKIKVWDFKNGKKGKKVTRVMYLTVNKKLAPSVQKMFEELYQSSERQVIHDIGCYSYRTGEHMYGMAIDINANENYMIDGGKVLAGSFWKPKKNAYSIPADCEFVRILSRYGFERGAWGDRKDYMHFSYFGT